MSNSNTSKDLRASLSKLERDIETFSKILKRSAVPSLDSLSLSSNDTGDRVENVNELPLAVSNIPHDVVRRRRRIKDDLGPLDQSWTTLGRHKKRKRISRTTTIALISLDEDISRITPVRKVLNEESIEVDKTIHPDDNDSRNEEAENNDNDDKEENKTCLFCPRQISRYLNKRPILGLFLIIMFNGLVSIICSTIIMLLEKPAQEQRFKEKGDLKNHLHELQNNISQAITDNNNDPGSKKKILKMLKEFDDRVMDIKKYPEEIPWSILSAQSFITSIQTTTGNGDIVPMTTKGKIFTLLYAMYGIPVFLWYIFKLGGLFRILVLEAARAIAKCLWSDWTDQVKVHPSQNQTKNDENDEDDEDDSSNSSLDARFHPSIIGVILLVFLLSVSAFISHIENISYFDSLYASFITYSTIGFGDIDIFQYSFRSNWFNFLIYGNGLHIMGYMIVSAYVTSILDKFGGGRKF